MLKGLTAAMSPGQGLVWIAERARRQSGSFNGVGLGRGAVGPDRLELSTSVLSGPRSNRLSYGPMLTQRDYINTPVSVQPRRDHDKQRTQ